MKKSLTLFKRSSALKISTVLICALLSTLTSAQAFAGSDRALKRIVTQAGKDIGGYSESHALLIGESRYTAGWPNIESIPHELKTVEKALKARGFDVRTKLNLDGRSLQNAYQEFIDDYGYNPNNRLLFYYSGHGHTMNKGEKGYLVPTDAPNPDKDPRGFKRKSLDMNQIVSWSRQMEAKHALFLFDSCFSGTIFKQKALSKLPKNINRLTSKPVRQFITAGGAGETVPAQSTFTPAFVDAITYGQGDLNHDGYISGTELGLYLQDVVPQHVAQTPQYGKISDYNLSQGDFVFFPVNGAMTLPSIPSSISARPDAELLFWQGVSDVNSAEMYRSYLKNYPKGLFVSIAKSKIKKLSTLSKASLPVVKRPALRPFSLVLSKADKRYTYNDDGTVTDPGTGLQWMRCLLGQHWNGETCEGNATGLNWVEAKQAVNGFNQSGGFSGRQDWQMPSKNELSSLIYCSSGEPKFWNNTGGECEGRFNKPAMSQKAFPNASQYVGEGSHKPGVLWGSPFAFFTNFLIGEVDFEKGFSHNKENVEAPSVVRLVRSADY